MCRFVKIDFLVLGIFILEEDLFLVVLLFVFCVFFGVSLFSKLCFKLFIMLGGLRVIGGL